MSRSIPPESVAAAANGSAAAISRVVGGVNPLVVHRCRAEFGAEHRHRADAIATRIVNDVIAALPRYASQPEKFLPFVIKTTSKRIDRERAKSDVNRAGRSPMETLIEGLPARQRDVLILRVLGGLSADETAVALGRTANVVRIDQHRAMKRLRTLIAAPDPAGSRDARQHA